jgi:hypothetical protein
VGVGEMGTLRVGGGSKVQCLKSGVIFETIT